MTQAELNEKLKQHKLWLDSNGVEGKRLELRNVDLTDLNLSYADLSYADLSYADLRGADLKCTDLRGANLRDADLRCADLLGANLEHTDLEGADLEGVDLEGDNLESTGVCFFIGPKHMGIYDSKDDKLFIGCQVHNLDYWLQNYIDIGRKYEYAEEEIEKYGNWFKSLKELL